MFLIRPVISLCLGLFIPSVLGNVYVAVASNFDTTFDKIKKAFNKHNKVKVIKSSASSGQLYAQVINGAPYDIFLSADSMRPKALEKNKQIIPDSRFTYAVGELVLWAPDKKIKNITDVKRALNDKKNKYVALAQPSIAPYGLAAEQALMKMGLYKQLSPAFVYGENINQAFSYIVSANAKIGFVALSQILNYKKKNHLNSDSVWLVPQHFYHPIKQQAVLLKQAEKNADAKKFFAFMKTKEVKKIIRDSGYQ